MIKVLRATEAEFTILNGYTKNNSVLIFLETEIGYICSIEVLNDANFSEIKLELEALEVVNYQISTDEN